MARAKRSGAGAFLVRPLGGGGGGTGAASVRARVPPPGGPEQCLAAQRKAGAVRWRRGISRRTDRSADRCADRRTLRDSVNASRCREPQRSARGRQPRRVERGVAGTPCDCHLTALCAFVIHRGSVLEASEVVEREKGAGNGRKKTAQQRRSPTRSSWGFQVALSHGHAQRYPTQTRRPCSLPSRCMLVESRSLRHAEAARARLSPSRSAMLMLPGSSQTEVCDEIFIRNIGDEPIPVLVGRTARSPLAVPRPSPWRTP
jgi:hypothetical protein